MGGKDGYRVLDLGVLVMDVKHVLSVETIEESDTTKTKYSQRMIETFANVKGYRDIYTWKKMSERRTHPYTCAPHKTRQ